MRPASCQKLARGCLAAGRRVIIRIPHRAAGSGLLAMGLLVEPLPNETVQRPDPGLARGLWEAPSWLFYGVLVAAVVGGLAWALAALRSRRGGSSR
jgi:hypothetical protein